MRSTSYQEYLDELCARFWAYRKDAFGSSDHLFDKPMSSSHSRVPVFLRERACADRNVLVRADASGEERDEVLGTLTFRKRHRYFGSMRSSQALAQSVFANLKVSNALDCLHDVRDESGPLFPGVSADSLCMEHEIDCLGEGKRGKTSVDAMFMGTYQVAVECKLTEADVGHCSRPKLKKGHDEWCDGNYRLQDGRIERCALSKKGILYWDLLPKMVNWAAESDLCPCPLRDTYQLGRNLLAACARQGDGETVVRPMDGHAVLIIDRRNPAFQEGGPGYAAVVAVRAGLHDPTRLRVCTWQQVLAAMRKNSRLAWLTDALQMKYGL